MAEVWYGVAVMLALLVFLTASCFAQPMGNPWERQYSNVEECIVAYFNSGCQYLVILEYLHRYHGIHMSLRNLRRILNEKLGLFRRPQPSSSVKEVLSAMKKECDGSSPTALLGYRSWTGILNRKYCLRVTMKMVMKILQQVDPQGCVSRRKRRLHRRKYSSPGPNWAWHIDGYDKLKRWGICISGAIDGFSRKIIFLKAGPTNSDPMVISRYFLDAIVEIGGCPCILQTDCGTENGIIANLQTMFCRGSSKNKNIIGHKYSSSPHNQRIEAWWAQLRKSKAQFWISKFTELSANGWYDFGNQHHQWALQYCCMDVIQKDLNEVAFFLWNSHRIRNNKASECLSGIPNELYFLPQTHGIEDQKIKVPDHLLQWAYGHKCKVNGKTGNPKFERFMEYVLERMGLHKPTDWRSAIQLYMSVFRHLK